MCAKWIKIIFAALVLVSFAFLVFIAMPREEKKPVAFFAYGANLDASTLRARAGGFENSTAAVLRGYKLAFQSNRNTEFGVANIVPDGSASVVGAIYVLTPGQMDALDKSANVPNFYAKKNVRVELANGQELDAVAYYLAGSAVFAAPSRPTLYAASEGLAQFGYGKGEQEGLSAAAAEALPDGS